MAKANDKQEAILLLAQHYLPPKKWHSSRVGYWARGKPLSAEVRFFAKVNKEENGCWTWIGSRNERFGLSYGRFWNGEKVIYAHIWAYLHLGKKEILSGMELDHLCRNTVCVNPDHLEAVTHRENVLRGTSLFAERAKRTHCHLGHLLSEENLYADKQGGRHCKRCRRKSYRKAYEKKHPGCRRNASCYSFERTEPNF